MKYIQSLIYTANKTHRQCLDLCDRSVLGKFDIRLYAVFFARSILIRKWVLNKLIQEITGDK